MTNGIFLLLGGNLGDPEILFYKTQDLLSTEDIDIINTSALYKSEAWGKTDQPPFLNQVLEIFTLNDPCDLLKIILSIELKLGRERKEKWGPRIIDIDILYFHQQIVNTKELTIPHPEIQNRRFALMPMCEIAPLFQHPIYKKSQQWLLANCQDNLSVERLD